MENLNNGWIHGKCRLPDAADGDADGRVFVWHAYQGAMLTPWNEFDRNSFNVYWMRVSDGASAPWIAAVERLPTKEDSDALNCVLAKDMHDGISVTGFHQFGWNSALTHWQRLPAPPSDYKELRRMK